MGVATNLGYIFILLKNINIKRFNNYHNIVYSQMKSE